MQQLLDLIAEMIAILLAEAKEKPELVDGIDNLSEKDDNTRRIEAQNLLESYGFGKKYTHSIHYYGNKYAMILCFPQMKKK